MNGFVGLFCTGNRLSEHNSDRKSAPDCLFAWESWPTENRTKNKSGRCLTLRSDFGLQTGFSSLVFIGKRAGEGNRTPVCSLGSCRSTIELHPRRDFRFSIADLRFASRQQSLPGNHVAGTKEIVQSTTLAA
jgi:hypothetical protein